MQLIQLVQMSCQMTVQHQLNISNCSMRCTLHFSGLQPASVDEVASIINSTKCKNSPIDVIPTVVLKRCVDIFAPSLAHLANLSFSSGVFPEKFKLGHVIPLIKKAGSDAQDPSNYRPITNLVTISKILERLVLARLGPHVHTSKGFSSFQSAYRRRHSTETALLRVANDLNTSMESGSKSVLLSLDISAAFDTIDIDKLLLRLDSDFGVCGMASTWFRSYLTGRTCYVAMGDLKSDVWSCDSGVPQGSVLGPVLFSAFVSPISRIMESHGIMYHQYADDTQLYTEVRSPVPSEMEALAQCVSALTFWFLDNGLQLNSSKSEAMILGSRQGLSRMEPVGSLVIGGDRVEVRDDIKILGVHLDPTLSMNAQVKAVIKASNFHIRALRHVRQGLTLESTKMIALGLVTSRLDYCNSLLYGTSKTNTAKLQRVQNDLARVVLRAAWNSSSKPLLKQLHWLPVQQRITFKIALITFNVRSSEQPSYLHSLLDNYTPSRNLRSEGQHLLRVPFRKSAAARRSFCFAAPTIWNSLSLSTREATSIGTFKTRLKTELFFSAFQ